MKLSYLWKGALGFLLILFVVVMVLFVMALWRIPGQQTFESYSLPPTVITLEQNWSADERQQVHYTDFGSEIMPYAVFAALELADSQTKLASAEVMDRLGFIVQEASENNPAGLPVGFALDRDNGRDWVGLTCTACHTAMLTHGDHTLLIEGGPGLLDFNQFEATIAASLNATLTNADKFNRLAVAVGSNTESGKKALREDLTRSSEFFNRRLKTNAVTVPYGHGRLDAFGRIFNAVTSAALHMPDNFNVPDAPVSIPMLWDAPHFDVVQWNGSAPNKNPGPLGQNVTTALAVYGSITMTEPTWGYPSSVQVANLGYIQSMMYRLMSPKWPEKVFGALDRDLMARGETLYRERCVSCHTLIDDRDPKRQIKTTLIDVNDIQTDPVMASNFATRRSRTGPLEGKKLAFVAGDRFEKEAPTIEIVINAAIGAMLRKPVDVLSAYIAEDEAVPDATINFTRQAYKARPLNGVWATAPFLHNGSVPSLYDLLQAPENRVANFYVGSRELDTKKVGLVSEANEHHSYFDTTLYGNSNAGHNFTADLNDDQRWALIEYLKSL